MWKVLKIYGVGEKLLDATKFYKDSKACVKADGKLSESIEISVGVREGCVMSPWLFSLYIHGSVKEITTRIGKEGEKLV